MASTPAEKFIYTSRRQKLACIGPLERLGHGIDRCTSRMKNHWGSWRSVAISNISIKIVALTFILLLGMSATQSAAALPLDFQETTVFDGLNQPTALQFSPDGRVFIAEKRGVILVYDDLSDSMPTV